MLGGCSEYVALNPQHAFAHLKITALMACLLRLMQAAAETASLHRFSPLYGGQSRRKPKLRPKSRIIIGVPSFPYGLACRPDACRVFLTAVKQAKPKETLVSMVATNDSGLGKEAKCLDMTV